MVVVDVITCVSNDIPSRENTQANHYQPVHQCQSHAQLISDQSSRSLSCEAELKYESVICIWR